jgi:hypothetical protein
MLLVQRAKLCLDFACTLHLFHYMVVWIYSRGIPNAFLWWFVYVGSCTIMTMGGEHLCMRQELKPIILKPFGSGRKQRQQEGADDVEMQPVLAADAGSSRSL